LKSASFFFLGSDSVLRISMGIIFSPLKNWASKTW
jgi:hypothetical protein